MKVRPALIVSVDAFQQSGPTVVVVPGSSQLHPGNSFHVPFSYQFQGRQITTFFCCDHVRTVDVQARLRSRMAPQPVPTRVLGQVEQHLRAIMGL